MRSVKMAYDILAGPFVSLCHFVPSVRTVHPTNMGSACAISVASAFPSIVKTIAMNEFKVRTTSKKWISISVDTTYADFISDMNM